jgi:hypothetical protein
MQYRSTRARQGRVRRSTRASQAKVVPRLAAARADLDLAKGRIEEAQAWAVRAIDMAVASSRKKYEAIGRITLGRALVAGGLGHEAVGELRRAVAGAEAIRSPFIRWQALAALGAALAASGSDSSGPRLEAAAVVRSISEDLSAEHAATFLADQRVTEVLEAAR